MSADAALLVSLSEGGGYRSREFFCGKVAADKKETCVA
jgi:hypothetical protein